MPFSSLQTRALNLHDFGALQARYQAMSLKTLAASMLEDAAPALELAAEILEHMGTHPLSTKAIASLRGNAALMGRLRPSEAKNQLIDSSVDFVEAAQHKLAAWKKSLERVASGEGVTGADAKERLKSDSPLAVALMGPSGISHYLSVIQLALGEMVRLDDKHSSQYAKVTALLRRCSTVISDCESASELQRLIA